MEFPNQIKMSGLPLMWCGFNEVFTKTDSISDGCPIYRMESYKMFGLNAFFLYIEKTFIFSKILKTSEPSLVCLQLK